MKPHLESLIRTALDEVLDGSGVAVPEAITIDATKDTRHGDFACNVALALAKPLGKPPRKVAEAIVGQLPASDHVEKVEIAGPGFINFFLADGAFQAVIPEILERGQAFGTVDQDQGKVLVEFVSANPTGPLHVGHGRGAAYGDALANVLAAAGYTVHREYYINDAGRQVDVLALSVWLRYLEQHGETLDFPARAYPSDYVRDTARLLDGKFGKDLFHPADKVYAGVKAEPKAGDGDDEAALADIKTAQEAYVDGLVAHMRELLGARYGEVAAFALDQQLGKIRATLDAFGVRFDQWYSERDLVESGAAEKARAKLVASGHTYEKDGALWFRTTEHGDDKDRVLVRANGVPTYFGNDLAYHVDKMDRGYPSLIDVWGADHHGLLVRMRAAIWSLTGRDDALRIPMMQFVTLSSGRMGKRSGNFVTLDELLHEAGRDETRFFYLLRSHDQHLEFDIELARSKTNENPVYYVQYACARVASVFRQAEERNLPWDRAASAQCLHRLAEPQEKALLTQLNRYPEMLRNAAEQLAPHAVTFYVRDLADAFHGWYNACQFLVEDAELRNARLALVAATGQVLRNGLALLGVSAPDRM